MSLLTGDPRTATVLARGDTVVMEVGASAFRQLGATHPQAVEQIGMAAVGRRVALDAARTVSQGAAVADAPASIMKRMRKFLHF
jgi:CRP-like cAMP-binding protein